MLYRAADAFVCPSLYEGFGLPPLEAMACGCPVVCSTRGALGEVVGNAAILVDPENVDDLCGGLTRVATQEDLRDALRKMGLEHAGRFDWQRTAAQTLEVYERAMRPSKKVKARLILSEQLNPR